MVQTAICRPCPGSANSPKRKEPWNLDRVEVELRGISCLCARRRLDVPGNAKEGKEPMNSDHAIKPLQFDTATSSAPAEAGSVQEGVACTACRRTMQDEYFDVDGQSTCPSCRDAIANYAEPPREWGVLARACLFGFVAAVLGAIVYYAVIAITDFEIGIVAIAIGYMVGYGIRMATKGRGGRRFQIMALVLTYWAVGLAYTPLIIAGAMKQDGVQQASDNASPNTTAPAGAPAAPDGPDAAGAVNLPMALAFLVGLTFALPVMVVTSSLPGGLISAFIIAIGMQQAWRMTAAPQPQITGPYRIGAGPPALA